MVMPEKFEPELVANALLICDGSILNAAKLLGTNWHTINRYVKKYPECYEAKELGVDHIVMLARGAAVARLKAAIADPINVKADKVIELVLRSKDGWTQTNRTELTGKDGSDLFASLAAHEKAVLAERGISAGILVESLVDEIRERTQADESAARLAMEADDDGANDNSEVER